MFRSIVSFGCAALMLIGAFSVSAQDSTGYAGVQNNAIVIQQGGENIAQVTSPQNNGYSSPVWSRDGSKLAYILVDTEFNYRLMVADADGSDPVQLTNAGRLESGFPISWTPDGQILFASSPDPAPAPPEPYQVMFSTVAPQVDAMPQPIGAVPFGVGCGGGSPIPADWQYWAETGFGGNFLTLEWTDMGVLYSVNCGGSGYALLAPNAEEPRYVTPVEMVEGMPMTSDNITRAKLSPDGTRLVAIRTNAQDTAPVSSVVIVDLSTGAITDVPTLFQPDQVAWSASGDIYYAARAEANPNLLDTLTPEQRDRLEAIWQDAAIPSYTVTISHVDVETGEEMALHTADAFAVGRMLETSDGSLWFSLVPNLNAWVQAIGDGTIDPVNRPDTQQQLDTVPVSVNRLMNGSVETIADNFNQFTLIPVMG